MILLHLGIPQNIIIYYLFIFIKNFFWRQEMERLESLWVKYQLYVLHVVQVML